MMKKTSGLFHRAGFEYVKMDFMTHGAMEADKWYNPEITTGIQGYNYGMKLLNQYFGDMYINLSISPVFPAQYAQSRRIACDAESDQGYRIYIERSFIRLVAEVYLSI